MKIPNNCNESRLRSDTSKSNLSLPRRFSDVSSTGSADSFYSANSETPIQPSSPSPSLGSRRMTWTCGRPVAIDKLVNKLEIPHTFVIHSYKRPTVCNVCRKLVIQVAIVWYAMLSNLQPTGIASSAISNDYPFRSPNVATISILLTTFLFQMTKSLVSFFAAERLVQTRLSM